MRLQPLRTRLITWLTRRG